MKNIGLQNVYGLVKWFFKEELTPIITVGGNTLLLFGVLLMDSVWKLRNEVSHGGDLVHPQLMFLGHGTGYQPSL